MPIKLNVNPPEGWARAKCKGTVQGGYDPFFDDDEMPEAVEFCNGTADGVVCPIREQCLIYALGNREKFGVWGGASELTRKGILKKYPPKTKEVPPEWQWMTEAEALQGLDIRALERELAKDKAMTEEFYED